jgi:hypothetical protein
MSEEALRKLERERDEWKAKAAELATQRDTLVKYHATCRCGSPVEPPRYSYAIPTCFKCLPPPAPLKTVEMRRVEPRTLTLAEVEAGAERASDRVEAWPAWKRELSARGASFPTPPSAVLPEERVSELWRVAKGDALHDILMRFSRLIEQETREAVAAEERATDRYERIEAAQKLLDVYAEDVRKTIVDWIRPRDPQMAADIESGEIGKVKRDDRPLP